jgi:two-component system chemotaxis sensor kinase CheA
MSTPESDFLTSLRAAFAVEAVEHVHAIATGLLALEQTPARAAQGPLIETVFRAAHSLKGAARAVDFVEIESHCQRLEEMFAAWKRHESVPSPTALDTVHHTLNAIAAALSVPAVAVPTPAAEQPVEQPALLSDETVRITVSKLDRRLVEAEEMFTAKLATSQRAEDMHAMERRIEEWKKAWTAVEPDVRALRHTMDHAARGRTSSVAPPSSTPRVVRLLEFLDWNMDYVKSLGTAAAVLTRMADQDRHVIGKLVDDLLEDSKKLLLLPFSTLVAPFAKLVRDLCRDQGKEAELIIRGEDVEVDKRILEEMKDPLIHLLRNCVDHGIETPAVRSKSGKPSTATITLAVSRLNGSKVEILVSDDGAGINADKVKESAIKQGLLVEDDAHQFGDAELQALIFQTTVSTSPIITHLSGRGLGLAIVREKAEKMGGSVSVESEPGRGTCFRIVLPSMLATFRGVLIETAGRVFVVPTAHVERVARVKTEDVRTVEGRETIVLSGHAVARVPLADVLELPRTEYADARPASTLAVVIGVGDQRIAFTVDAVLDEQEVLVKRLANPLSRVRNVAGATVLGSGQVVLILNVTDLLKSARRTGTAPTRRAPVPPAKATSILVAEDSITSRMLIKSILESAGYTVKTAVDGMEAFTLLRAEQFDLVVSDVEMPRLNGFDLTARIRGDKKLAELPVVLVTALETREDRERGIHVGANAYIIKSSFDQSNLLAVVQQLV